MTELTVPEEGAGTYASVDRHLLRHLPDVTDDRFSSLMSEAEWRSLPRVVQARFSRPLGADAQRTFVGEVLSTRHSRAGLLLAHLARFVGGPLPDTPNATGPSVVTMTSDSVLGGQIWTRTYARPGRMPQTINSVKRFHGATGLEEYLGCGLFMRLTLHVEAGALVFRSVGFDVGIGGRRWPIPAALSPGHCTITHRDQGGDRFSFTLTLDHPWLGRLIEQIALYEEITP